VSAVGLGKPDVFAGVHTFIVHHRRRNLIPRKTLTSNPIKKKFGNYAAPRRTQPAPIPLRGRFTNRIGVTTRTIERQIDDGRSARRPSECLRCFDVPRHFDNLTASLKILVKGCKIFLPALDFAVGTRAQPSSPQPGSWLS
jgi:hypothetical protein